MPSGDGPVGSGLVQMNRAPRAISRTAVVIASKLYVLVSPSTTYSGSRLVRMYPALCSAVVSPASPITYAVPPGRWSLRNWAVARAEVQIADSGTSMPIRASRAWRSRAV
jgi:hypothetical protein